MKVFIEGMNLAGVEVCRVQKIVTVGDAERRAFVNGAVNAWFVPLSTAMIAWVPIQRRVPAGDGTVFTDEDKASGRRVSIFCHLEERACR